MSVPIKNVILGMAEGQTRGPGSEDLKVGRPNSGMPGTAGSSGSLSERREDDVPGAAVRTESGDLHIRLAGVWATLLPSGALWIEAERALVCADLHLEKGSAYAARGQLLPPYDTRETLRRLANDVARRDPQLVILLGDTLHDGGAGERIADEDAQMLRSIARGRDLLWIVGNHDPQGPQSLPGKSTGEVSFGSLILRHEPQAGRQPGEIAGHLHPCARVTAAARSVRRRCFVTDGSRMVLPAYGAYAGGLSVRDAAFAGLFAAAPLIGAIGTHRVHAVGWRSVLGD
jgi:DNA ligase-associated metallophosphoesterase